MAVISQTPAPFEAGFRTLEGLAINAALAEALASSMTGIVALAGGGLTGAPVLTAKFSRIITVASGNDSVRLPPALPGKLRLIANDGANTLKVYPYSTVDTVNGTTSFDIATVKLGIAFCSALNLWNIYAVG